VWLWLIGLGEPVLDALADAELQDVLLVHRLSRCRCRCGEADDGRFVR
jgi:hypothetical protein